MLYEFSFDTEYGPFCDVIWIPEDQPAPSDAEIETMKQQRLATWLDLIQHPQEYQAGQEGNLAA
jgi:hypothetical protein